MAYSRMIRQNFFNEPKLSRYTPLQRYLLIGLVCNADDYGKFWYNESYINKAVFPMDKDIEDEWIKKTLDKLVKDEILCKYEVDGDKYAHFPKWFDNGWYLKQYLSKPREFVSPDCPICQTEKKSRKFRELSKTSKDKISQLKGKNKKLKENIITLFTDPDYIDYLEEIYPFVFHACKYDKSIDIYLRYVEKNDSWNVDHKEKFEKQLSNFNEKVENEYPQ